uniref:Uncharacterized protein LOC114334419 isoform X1 n=1 Tax=Diabrotica virgifera virgifera TaxID=50390 RepID=A0A6P7FV75_DIAVI
MPRSKTGKKREAINPELLKGALESIFHEDPTKRISCRQASKVIKISRATLAREARKFQEPEGGEYHYSVNYAVRQVFTDIEETCLVEYIKKIALMQYGLSKKGVRQLAYKYAVANNKKFPDSWHTKKLPVKSG